MQQHAALQTTAVRQRLVFSRHSSGPVPNSLWYSKDFLLGAGTVIIQPATRKVVILYDPLKRFWFLPKGRKDVGESLEQTALREAYEESGYRAQFLPLNIPTRAPTAPIATHNETPGTLTNDTHSVVSSRPNTEPIFISTYAFTRPAPRSGGEYITFWYAAFIGPDAIREEGTGMPDEKHFETHLMSCDEAIRRLSADTEGSMEAYIVRMVYNLWLDTEWSEAQHST